jgi:hypothetical protein
VSEETVKSGRSLWRVIARFILWGLVILVFTIFTMSIVLIEIPIHFALGWIFHAWKLFPELIVHWRMVLVPLGCLILGTWLCHRFIVWCMLAKKSLRVWRPQNTMALVALLLLGSAAAIALSGVVHQGVWLMADPWVENRGKRVFLTTAMINARQLMMAITEFQETNNRQPDSFEEMGKELGIEREILHRLVWIQTQPGKLKEPFVLLHPGSKRVFGGREPVILSPKFNDLNKVVVGYGDTSVGMSPTDKFVKVLESYQSDRILEKAR